MLANEGLYIAFDPEHSNAVIPIVSRDRRLHSLMIDSEISPHRFFDRTKLHGPFWPLESNRLAR
jgi:hypothetical protein